jgi:hypothetical protein
MGADALIFFGSKIGRTVNYNINNSHINFPSNRFGVTPFYSLYAKLKSWRVPVCGKEYPNCPGR